MKVAIYSFSSCEGCRYTIVNELDKVLETLEKLGVEIVREPLLGLGEEPANYDIAIIEGALTSEEDVNKVKEIRRKCKYLIALGSCAALGGIVAFMYKHKGEVTRFDKKYIFGEPLHKFVKVDAVVKGCPIKVGEFLTIIEFLAKGLPVEELERRFQYIKVSEKVIDDGLLKLDTGKCVVCGRCVEICSLLGINALDYGFRGSSIIVTTPFFKKFAEVGCIHCGLCAGYCPVAAVTYRDDISRALELIKSGDVSILIDGWALKGLAEALEVDAGKVIASLKLLGAKEVKLWDPLEGVEKVSEPAIVPVSSAESEYVRKFYPELSKYLTEYPRPAIGDKTLVITSCAARKKDLDLVLTAQETLKILESLIGREQIANVEAEEVPQLSGRASEKVKVLQGPDEVRRGLEEFKDNPRNILVLQLCFGGCNYGSGQPYRLLDKTTYIH
ncbi:MAG: hypothetical protein DRO14_02685 [Thermoprotei archaeon]|nr:MAG: hypothetical protein DRO14_02685 [Thermoprotei archaeon]